MHDRVTAINQMEPAAARGGGRGDGAGRAIGYEAGRSLPRRSPGHVVPTHRQGREPVLPGWQRGRGRGGPVRQGRETVQGHRGQADEDGAGRGQAEIAGDLVDLAEINGHVEGILNNAAELFVSQRASQQVFEQSNPLLKKAREQVDALAGLASARAGLTYRYFRRRRFIDAVPVLLARRLVVDAKRHESEAAERRTRERRNEPADAGLGFSSCSTKWAASPTAISPFSRK